MRINPLDNLFCPEQLNRSASHNDIYLEADQETQPAPEPGSFFFSAFNGNQTFVTTTEQQQQNAITTYTIPVTKTTNSKTIQHVTINPTPGQLPTNIRTRPMIQSIQSQTNSFQNGKCQIHNM